MSGWIGVDLDGTLASWHGWNVEIGPPVLAMTSRVKNWIRAGIEVRIFTARACAPEQIPMIQAWCLKHIGVVLEVTNVKDFDCMQIWDDRAVRVPINSGAPCCGNHEYQIPLPVPPAAES